MSNTALIIGRASGVILRRAADYILAHLILE